MHTLCCLSLPALIVGLCKRESNQPRPGVEPGGPQHEAEDWTLCPRSREHAQRCSYSRPSLFVRERKDPAKMTDTKMVLVERGLGAKRAHAKSQLVKMMVGWVCVGRCIGCAH